MVTFLIFNMPFPPLAGGWPFWELGFDPSFSGLELVFASRGIGVGPSLS